MNAMLPANPQSVVPTQATSDDHLVSLWLYGRSLHTQRAYGADIARFREFTGKPFGMVTLSDLQAFQDSLGASAASSVARTLSSVKSLLSFGQRVGYLPFNVGAVIRLPKVKDNLAERILAEDEVIRMLALEPNERDRAVLEVFYFSGCRIGELVGLRWRDVQPNGEDGQLTVFGKGGKTRVVKLPSRIYKRLCGLRNGADASQPVFVSQKGNPLSRERVHAIVREAAARVGIPAKVSAHWLRHAHASHALDNGAPAHLVKETLGHSSLATTSRYTHARPSDSSGLYLRG